MKCIILPLIMLIGISNAFSGNDNFPVGARSSAMGNASVTFQDIWAYNHNQAGLASLENISLAFHHENRFLLNENSMQSFGVAVPTNSGVFSLNLNYFGYSNYNESKIGFSYSRKLIDKLFIGIQMDYFYNYIADNYGNNSAVAAEIGILAEPVEKLFVGIHVFNPTRSLMDDYNNERIPTIFKIGLGYKFSDKLYISCETEKDLDKKPVYKAGFEYMAIDNLYFRIGILTNPLQNSFGIGYKISRFKADIAFSTHPTLGVTPYVSLSYCFNRTQTDEN